MENANPLPTQGGMYEYRDGIMVAVEGPAAQAQAPAPAPGAGGDVDQPTGDQA